MAMRVRKPDGNVVEIEAPARPVAVSELNSDYPVPYYNPVIPDERFAMEGQGYKLRFAAGRFVATNEAEEAAVRAALRIHGPNVADRWRGDDRKNEWTCKKCAFRTRNDNAKDDHEGRH